MLQRIARAGVALALLVSAGGARAAWERLPTALGQGDYCEHLLFLPSGFGALVIKPRDLLLTRDDGDTWRRIAGPAGLYAKVSAWIDERTGLVAGWGEGAALPLAFTDDGGASFRPAALDLLPAAGEVRRITVRELSYATRSIAGFEAWIDRGAGFSHALIARTVDGGRSWKEVAVPCGAGRARFLGERGGAFFGSCGAHHTTDGGATWRRSEGDAVMTSGASVDTLFFVDEKTGIASTYEKLWRTDDGGASWTLVSEAAYGSSLPAQYFRGTAGSLLGANAARQLFRSMDLGRRWVRADPPDHLRGIGSVECMAHPRAGRGRGGERGCRGTVRRRP